MTEAIIISAVLAVLTAAGVVFAIVYRYKRGITSPIYPLENYTRLTLTYKDDRFVDRRLTVVKVSSNNNKK